MVCMEMISAKALLYRNKNTQELLEISPEEGKVSLQLFGNDPQILADMAKEIEERPFDILDINMGCPVPKVAGNGEGSALMKDPVLVGRIVEAVSKAIRKPVTVKIRKGFDNKHVNAVEIAHVAQESGAAAVAVHGRTREQYYAGEADWDIIRQVKEALTIPVLGNGDVVDGPSAKRMLEETGCDGVLVGRAARGNPWIFREINTYLSEGIELPRPNYETVKQMMFTHARKLVECKGEYIAVREMRKHVAWYTAGYPNSASMRRKVNELETYAQLQEFLDTYPIYGI